MFSALNTDNSRCSIKEQQQDLHSHSHTHELTYTTAKTTIVETNKIPIPIKVGEVFIKSINANILRCPVYDNVFAFV